MLCILLLFNNYVFAFNFIVVFNSNSQRVHRLNGVIPTIVFLTPLLVFVVNNQVLLFVNKIPSLKHYYFKNTITPIVLSQNRECALLY